MGNVQIRQEFIDTDGAVIDVLSIDQIVAPKSEADVFLQKTSRGPQLHRLWILIQWHEGIITANEAMAWLLAHGLVRLDDIPEEAEDYDGWLKAYGKVR